MLQPSWRIDSLRAEHVVRRRGIQSDVRDAVAERRIVPLDVRRVVQENDRAEEPEVIQVARVRAQRAAGEVEDVAPLGVVRAVDGRVGDDGIVQFRYVPRGAGEREERAFGIARRRIADVLAVVGETQGRAPDVEFVGIAHRERRDGESDVVAERRLARLPRLELDLAAPEHATRPLFEGVRSLRVAHRADVSAPVVEPTKIGIRHEHAGRVVAAQLGDDERRQRRAAVSRRRRRPGGVLVDDEQRVRELELARDAREHHRVEPPLVAPQEDFVRKHAAVEDDEAPLVELGVQHRREQRGDLGARLRPRDRERLDAPPEFGEHRGFRDEIVAVVVFFMFGDPLLKKTTRWVFFFSRCGRVSSEHSIENHVGVRLPHAPRRSEGGVESLGSLRRRLGAQRATFRDGPGRDEESRRRERHPPRRPPGSAARHRKEEPCV
mmetsp:Transcript_6614/g.27786  ORF Transcript_6614/g.27786 Transcript_6614/m.27786 type:complete len:437 (+) Transcript_6614:541-1851(+)